MRKFLRFRRLRTQMAIALLLVAVVPLVVTGVILYEQRVKAIKSAAFDKLRGIRDLKVHELEAWLQGRTVDVVVMAGDEEVRRAATALITGDDNHDARDSVRRADELVRRVQKGYGIYDEIVIVSSDTGRVVLSTNSASNGDDYSQDVRFLQSLETVKTITHDIQFSEGQGVPSMSVSTPIHGLDAIPETTAVMIASIGLEHSLYEILRDHTGMGKTGETLIVNENGLALNELRYYEHAPLRLVIDAEPAMLAAQGNTGVTEAKDYRGEQVLAAYTHIEHMNWGFVAKQDLAEVYAPISAMIRGLLLVIIVVGIVSSAISLFFARTIVRPIVALTNVSHALHSGDLTARNTVRLSNELGQLAASFNEMAESLASLIDIQTRSAAISESLSSSSELSEASQSLVKTLLDVTESDLAVFYIRNKAGGTFEPQASIGANAEVLSPFDESIYEGGLGKALSTRMIARVSDIPGDTRFIFRTAWGAAVPKEMLAVPLLVDHEVDAVVSLASIRGYTELSLKALERAWPNLNTAMANLSATGRTRALAEELAQKNMELGAQTDELKAQTSELKAQAVELEAQRAQVEEADRLKSEFLSNMSHELRTPLNSVITLSELMSSRGPGKNIEKDTEYLRIIRHNGYHLLNLINDILDLSKIEAGRMDINLDHFEVGIPVKEVAEAVRSLADEKGLELRVGVGDMPTMYSDRGKVYQILLNLISNAVKFTETGSITVDASEKKGQVVFSIQDTGIGIPRSELKTIFDEFRQVDGSTTRRHEGTGLGLAICRRLAHLLGGEISVTSVPAEGSIFTLVLPIECSEQASHQLMAAKPTSPPTSRRQSPVASDRRTVLVVDDEREICDMLQGFLADYGYDVVTARNGSEALALAEQLQPFAITLDVLMPEMDGWELLAKLKDSITTADIPVIVISVSEDKATGSVLGATAFIPKPVTKELLLSEIDMLSQRRVVRNILVVDDDAAIREYFGAVLRERGYRVVTVAGGAEALESVSAYLPDVVVLDLMMPEVDGFSVLTALRRNATTHDLPVVVATAKDLTPEERRKLAESTERVIEKGSMGKERLLSELGNILADLDKQAIRSGANDKPRILVIEDNEVAALQVRSALEENGFAVTVAPGGTEALTSISRTVPDAVVLDLMMPDVDGFEVLERIRSTPWTRTLPVLVLTAKELTSEDRARLSYNNVQELIQKGAVKRDELVARIAGLVHTPQAAITPASPARETTEVTAKPIARDSRRPPEEGGLILIVEDNQDNMFTISEILDEAEYAYVKAADGTQGVEIAKNLKPALILMDIQLPGLSGIDATRQIRSIDAIADTPIIAITANAMKGDEEEILAAGCDAYISKPVDAETVVELIRQWIP